MLSASLILHTLQALTIQSAKSLTSRCGIDFTDEEIALILPYLKQNGAVLIATETRAKKIRNDLSGVVPEATIARLLELLARLGYR